MSASYRYPYAYPPQHPSSSLDRLLASSKGAWIAAGIATLYLCYTFSVPSILAELLWNVLVLITPTSLIIALDKRRNPDMYDGTADTQSSGDKYAIKSEALRRIFGLESGLGAALPGATSLRRASWLGGLTSRSDAPPGLGNWDNSCYQNSVLQGLSALQSLTTYLEHSDVTKSQDTSTTAGSLRELMANLNDSSNNGRRIWTPAKLKSMSSWQQQDAQEYFSKIMDDMEKETAKKFKVTPGTAGFQEVDDLGTIKTSGSKGRDAEVQDTTASQRRNPLDGFLAQRVACTSCGFSEGLSMIPFNCVTVPLGRNYHYKIEDCLKEYTNLEEISGVECARCTLLRTRSQLQHMTSETTDATDQSMPPASSLPAEVRATILQRLQAVEQALEEGDVSDETLNKKCQITKKSRVCSTKTRQAVIARAPQCLVIHVNRSVFDEYTGDQRKNLAEVTYPQTLDLRPWCLGATQDTSNREEWRMNPTESMIGSSSGSKKLQYVLRAAVTHQGRHENGHYICYREHPERVNACEGDAEQSRTSKWWRLSDDDVSAVSEQHALQQGGVFMLFYERLDVHEVSADAVQEPCPVNTIANDAVSASEADIQVPELETTENDGSALSEPALEPEPEVEVDKVVPQEVESRRVSTPQMMRTAGKGAKRRKNRLSSTLQAVAAT